MKALLTLTLTLLLVTAAASAAKPAPPARADTPTNTPTISLDAAARARLVGDHLLTLQWIGWGDLSGAGKVVVRDGGASLPMKGEQRGNGENAHDYVRVDGRIVSATRDGFVFEGDILVRVHHIADGAECKRSGTFTFKTTGKRKYWRLQEMQSPCDTTTDYVDVYFKGI